MAIDLDGIGERAEALIADISDGTFDGRNINAPTRSGAWRPDQPFEGEGIRVTMSRAPGLTPDGVLQVPFRFQTPPLDTLQRPRQNEWSTFDAIEGGEQPGRGGKRLDRFSLSTMFVDEYFPWLVWTGSYQPQRLLEELNAIMDAEAGFRLVVSQAPLWGKRPLVSMLAVMTSCTPEARGGEVGTEYTGVEFMETTRRKLERKRARRTGSSKEKARRHKLARGDTLHALARHYLSGASSWRKIASANGITGVQPDEADDLAAWAKRHDRQTLTIPAK